MTATVTFPTFSRTDAELLVRYGNARVRWDRVDAAGKRGLTNLRERVKALVLAAADVYAALPDQSSSRQGERQGNTPALGDPPMRTFVSPVHTNGRVRPDMWGCLYPANVPSKAFGLQLAMIVSEHGAELALCMGSGWREVRDPNTAAQNRRALEEAQQQLADLPADLIASVDAQLAGRWKFRTALRKSPRAANDFESFGDWLQYAASPRGSGAAVSRFLSPRTLERLGEEIGTHVTNLVEIFAPVFHAVYRDDAPPVPDLDTDAEPIATPARIIARGPYPSGAPATMFVAEGPAIPYGNGHNGNGRNGQSVRQAAPPAPFTLDDALDDLFLDRPTVEQMLALLERRRNVILEGAPGVGKTFVAQRLAYTLLGAKDPARMEMVQFHQSYAYEDFVQGWRPAAGGGFVLRNGVFLELCRAALMDPQRPYVFLIDEINRGNVSKIFGELLMLLERDKRGEAFAVPLTYAVGRTDRFAIPPNVYVIGTMNTADRSIALVDYALRRRFAFARLHPAFGTKAWAAYLKRHGVSKGLIQHIVARISALNEEIVEDRTRLGPGFEIGHSFFMPAESVKDDDMAWYRSVVHSEIEPLLREYWFDDPGRVADAVARLLA